MIRIFDEPDIRRALTARDAVETIRAAFQADGEGRTIVPPVINLPVERVRGEFHVKTALIDGVPHVAVKVASGFYENAAKGLPTGSGLMTVFDAATGVPVALLCDNGFLTDLRTGAAGAVAADCLARRDVRTVGVIGSGVQARFQVECLRAVRSFSTLVAWSPNRDRLERYCAEMRERFGLDVTAAPDAGAVCRVADIVVTTTPSREPIVLEEWLRPGIHVTAVGSDSPGKQELDAACLSRADLLVVDRRSQCVAFGESHAAPDRIAAELGEIVAGVKEGRSHDDQITVADLTGVGFQDTAIASLAYQRLGRASAQPATRA